MSFTGSCSRRMRRAALAALTASCLAATATRAQEQPWSKPMAEWTREDAQKVLNASPWARSQTIKVQQRKSGRIAGAPNPIGPDGNPMPLPTVANTATSGGAQAPVDYTFTMRLRSALPVRQALARLMQLDAAKLKDKERAAHETRIKGTLDCPACADNYVVTLSSRSEESQGSDPVYSAFAGARLDDIKRFVYLANDRGDQRALVHFVPPRSPGEEAVFFFPRLDERGEPLLTSTTKKLIFNVTKVEVSTVANFQIDVADITNKGEIVF